MEVSKLFIVLYLIVVILIFTGFWKCMHAQTFHVNQALNARVQALEESHILPYLHLSLLQMALFPVMPVVSEIYNKIEFSKPFGYFSI